MKTLLFIPCFIIFLLSCNTNSVKKDSTNSKSNFTLEANELKLLSSDPGSFEIYFDTINSISQYKKSRVIYIATTIPKHSCLFVTSSDSDRVSSIVGNETQNHSVDVNILNGYVKRLYLNEPDTTRYGQKFVRFNFPEDNCKWVDGYLTQLVMGYSHITKK